MSAEFKVACVQTSASADVLQNINAAVELVKAANAKHASLICLPEYFCYLDNDDSKMLANSFTEEQHPAISVFCTLAEKLHCWLLLGSLAIKVNEQKMNNRSYLIDSSGRIVARYNKLHLFDVDLKSNESYLESATVVAGDKPVLAPTPWGSIGMTICYDLRFPYLYRQLAQQGVNFFTIPAAFTKTTGEAHWHVLCRARAIETGSFVFASCQCGEHPGKRYTYGHSLIIDPWGTILSEAEEDPGYIIADIDVQQSKQARQKIPSLQHDQMI